jgi:hypothetical protein
MSRITYHPRIPTSRSVLPSQYQRLRASRWIIVNFNVDTNAFMDALQNIADTLNRAMRTE